MSHYGGSFAKALVALFPAVNFELHKFTVLTSNCQLFVLRHLQSLGNHWQSKKNQRVFFDQLAKKKNFDPRNLDDWLNLPKTHIYSEKVTTINDCPQLISSGRVFSAGVL